MLTSFSVNSLSSRSRCCRSPSPRPRRSPCVRAIVRAMRIPSEIEAALSGGVGQSLDPAVEQIGAAIEHNLRDPGCFRPLGDQLANSTRRGDVGTILEVRPEAAIEARSRRQGAPGRVVDDLRIDVLGRAEDREARPVVGGAAQIRPHALAPTQKEGFGCCGHRRYFFLPSLRRMVSVAYLMPFPL